MPAITDGKIAGVRVVTPEAHGDPRGRFLETWRAEWFPDLPPMVQSNRSDKAAGAVVGFHYHLRQADYWTVMRGRALVALHDLRAGSPTERATEVFEIDDVACRGVYIPPGVAHGFAALTDLTITYLVDRTYDPTDELGVAWNDPEIAVAWGIAEPILSKRDLASPRRAALPEGKRPRFGR